MTDQKVLAQGGFNTGRLYSAAGQRIFWTHTNGQVHFQDLDRMICGRFAHDDDAGEPTPRGIMQVYDRHEYLMDAPMTRVPEAFDFGPSLRI